MHACAAGTGDIVVLKSDRLKVGAGGHTLDEAVAALPSAIGAGQNVLWLLLAG
jgi:hypothetical protein